MTWESKAGSHILRTRGLIYDLVLTARCWGSYLILSKSSLFYRGWVIAVSTRQKGPSDYTVMLFLVPVNYQRFMVKTYFDVFVRRGFS